MNSNKFHNLLLSYFLLLLVATSGMVKLWGAETNSEAAVAPGPAVLKGMTKVEYRIFEDPNWSKADKEKQICSVKANNSLEFLVSVGYKETVVLTNVIGKTADETAAMLKAELDKKYYLNSHPSVFFVSEATFKEGVVMLRGSALGGKYVRMSFPVDSPPTISKALEAHVDQYAKLTKVKVRRDGKDISINVDEIIKGTARDFQLRDGDSIELSDKFFNLF